MTTGSHRIPEDELRQFVREREGQLIGVARRWVAGDSEKARDLVQESLLRLVSAPVPVPKAAWAPWLFRVCRNLALDHQRKETMQPLPESAAATLGDRAPTPPDVLEHRETSAGIVAALALLTAPQQEVLRLKFQGGLSYAEIAEVTGRSVGQVGSLIHHGLVALRDRLRIVRQPGGAS